MTRVVCRCGRVRNPYCLNTKLNMLCSSLWFMNQGSLCVSFFVSGWRILFGVSLIACRLSHAVRKSRANCIARLVLRHAIQYAQICRELDMDVAVAPSSLNASPFVKELSANAASAAIQSDSYRSMGASTGPGSASTIVPESVYSTTPTPSGTVGSSKDFRNTWGFQTKYPNAPEGALRYAFIPRGHVKISWFLVLKSASKSLALNRKDRATWPARADSWFAAWSSLQQPSA
mmetsp:Transcript_4547/g.10692  ORF Transcript_4547/g.10692 Transcript_4547/m.10692 type:complete len:232 (+) Transcript_4547:146-841(+)